MIDTPVVAHSHLLAFADDRVNLHRDDVAEYRAQVNRLRMKLEAHIASHPHYALEKMLSAGSVIKGTALSTLNDMDVAIYVRKTEAPSIEKELLSWMVDRLREAYPNLDSDQFNIQQHCVTVSFRGSGLDVDVVPVLYDGAEDDQGWLVPKDGGKLLLTSIPRHIKFIRSRRGLHGRSFTEFIRLVKWWIRQQKQADSEFRFKSFMAELVCSHLVDTGRVNLSDYVLALEDFFAYLIQSGLRELIAFTDCYEPASLPQASSDAIRIFDPVNPQNNVAGRYSVDDRTIIVSRAQEAFDSLTEAHYSTTQGRAYECWREVLGPSFGR